MKKLERVLIMAGGTGGHVFPGLAFAAHLREQGVVVHWLGTKEGLEARLVLASNLPLHFISIQGVRGKGMTSFLRMPFKMISAILQAMRVLYSVKPQVVIGMGGFVSAPGGIAAWLIRYPLVIHEQNAKTGLANQLLSLLSKKNCAGFETAFQVSPKTKVIGNPVRAEILRLLPPRDRLLPAHIPFHLLVLGGSRGARAINKLVPQALASLPAVRRPMVLHQTGNGHFDDTKNLYKSLGLDCDLKCFIDNMAEAYAWADLVICRAGALTVAELCTAGLGAIFIPYPYAVDDHQTANAHMMVQKKAALCYKESELSSVELAEIINQFSQMPLKRLAMAEAAYRLRRQDVSQNMYDICLEVMH